MSQDSQSPLQVRDQLAGTVRAWLKRDRDRAADPRVKRYLDYVGEHLFDHTLSVGKAYKACQVWESAFVPVFRTALGVSPKAHLDNLRLELSKRLLGETMYRLDLIADLTGYSSSDNFRKAFKRATKESPTEFRRHWKSAKSHQKEEMLDPNLQAHVERMGLEQARELQRRVHARFPELKEAGHPELEYSPSEQLWAAPHFTVTTPELEKLNAQRLWIEIQGLPHCQQLEKIRNAKHFTSQAFFNLLKRKAVEEGRSDRTQGVKIARLAIEASMAIERLDELGKSNVWAQAWTLMSIELRLAFELSASEQAIQKAELFLSSDADPLVAGEIMHEKAALLWYQKKPERGLDVLHQALEHFKRGNDKQPLIASLIMRAILNRALGKIELAVEDNLEAVRLLQETPNADLGNKVRYNLAVCYWEIGKHEHAESLLKGLRRDAELKHSEKHLIPFLDWLEGRLALEEGNYDAAAVVLSRVRSTFYLMSSKWSEIVSLDIAIVRFHLGRLDEIFDLLSEALPVLAAWKDLPEFTSIYRKLERSINRKIITSEILTEARDLTVRLGHDPESRSVLELKGML